MKTLVHQRVEAANQGTNPMAIIRLESGWVVLGDEQRIPGYCLLLSDPVAESLNDLSGAERAGFLGDMAAVGDALIEVLGVEIINYSILGNSERALHAHIHPRFEAEPEAFRRMPPWFYHFSKTESGVLPPMDDISFMARMREALARKG